MVLIQNTSDKNFKINFQGAEYIILVNEPVEIPEVAASLYFAYGIDSLTPEVIKWCCERIRTANPEFANLPDKEIWDNIICKVVFGKEVLKKSKK